MLKKEDLRELNRVTLRNGEKFLVMGGMLRSPLSRSSLGLWNEDLKHPTSDKLDIVKVERLDEEFEVLKQLLNDVEWKCSIEVNSEIDIYDLVKVIDNGRTYNLYEDFLDSVLPLSLHKFWMYNQLPKVGKTFEVIGKGRHLDHKNRELFFIQELDGKSIFLIAKEGIEKA